MEIQCIRRDVKAIRMSVGYRREGGETFSRCTSICGSHNNVVKWYPFILVHYIPVNKVNEYNINKQCKTTMSLIDTKLYAPLYSLYKMTKVE